MIRFIVTMHPTQTGSGIVVRYQHGEAPPASQELIYHFSTAWHQGNAAAFRAMLQGRSHASGCAAAVALDDAKQGPIGVAYLFSGSEASFIAAMIRTCSKDQP